MFVKWILSLGVGAWVWTADAENAYLRVPVNKSCWRYMGFKWFGILFVVCTLIFGLASACKIYTQFADAILWIILYNCESLFMSEGKINLPPIFRRLFRWR